jgi:hypothetical protein
MANQKLYLFWENWGKIVPYLKADKSSKPLDLERLKGWGKAPAKMHFAMKL